MAKNTKSVKIFSKLNFTVFTQCRYSINIIFQFFNIWFLIYWYISTIWRGVFFSDGPYMFSMISKECSIKLYIYNQLNFSENWCQIWKNFVNFPRYYALLKNVRKWHVNLDGTNHSIFSNIPRAYCNLMFSRKMSEKFQGYHIKYSSLKISYF